jgi:hypothetical protein
MQYIFPGGSGTVVHLLKTFNNRGKNTLEISEEWTNINLAESTNAFPRMADMLNTTHRLAPRLPRRQHAGDSRPSVYFMSANFPLSSLEYYKRNIGTCWELRGTFSLSDRGGRKAGASVRITV